MKILQVGKFYPIRGGVEKVMYDITVGLSERGIHCDMLTAIHGPSRDVVINEHGRLICCSTLVKLAATMISPAMIMRLRKICRHYDIIHIHHPDPMACLSLFLSGYKGKVVLHWHSDIVKQKFLLKLYRSLQSWLLKRADLVVGTTPVYLAESPFLAHVQDKTDCLPIGIEPVLPDAEAVAAIRSSYPGKKIIFTLGRLVPYKGYKFLVEAARYLGDDYMLLIGGEGPLRDELQADIDRHNLGHRVRLLGRVSDEDLPAYFGACDLFCMSSVYRTEAFGIVQIEAMSCGKPIVATTIPHSGVSWVNAHGISGLNVPPCDSHQLAAAITRICGDSALYEQFSQGASSRFDAVFTKKMMIDKLLHIYNKLWKMQK